MRSFGVFQDSYKRQRLYIKEKDIKGISEASSLESLPQCRALRFAGKMTEKSMCKIGLIQLQVCV